MPPSSRDTPVGNYLSKFAVDVGARGEGIGSDLWRAVCSGCPRLLWRSKPNNPIAAWYAQVCDGLDKRGDWHIFWRGIEPRRSPTPSPTPQRPPRTSNRPPSRYRATRSPAPRA